MAHWHSLWWGETYFYTCLWHHCGLLSHLACPISIHLWARWSWSHKYRQARKKGSAACCHDPSMTDWGCFVACTWCPKDVQHDLVAIVEQGVCRPISVNLPGSAVGARFPQLCLRKMYVICSRGGTSDGPDSCSHQVCHFSESKKVSRYLIYTTARF